MQRCTESQFPNILKNHVMADV